ncbi:16506_t:CDS:2 [Cetraspora pellucida]|uniref:16506_t:CDS:1 n=1 Tax=Cetraspora pellucida TaxID=1433469 RepID=A0A9N8VQW5_9GLOM|nr:16506_t:CDS:2 [Cetraspora pellucida]
MSNFNVPDFPPPAYKPYNQNSNNDDFIQTTSEDFEYSARIDSNLDDFTYSEEITVRRSTKNFEQVARVNSQKQLVRGKKPSTGNDDILSLYCEEIALHKAIAAKKQEELTRINSQKKLARGDSARKLRQLDKLSSENDYDSNIVERQQITTNSNRVLRSKETEEITLHRNASLRKLEAVTRVNSQRKLERGYSNRKLQQLDSFGPEDDYDSNLIEGQLVTTNPQDAFYSEEIALNKNASLRKLGAANYQNKLASDSFNELQQPNRDRPTNGHNSTNRSVTAFEQFQSWLINDGN